MGITTCEAPHVIEVSGVRILFAIGLSIEEDNKCPTDHLDTLLIVLQQLVEGSSSNNMCAHEESI